MCKMTRIHQCVARSGSNPLVHVCAIYGSMHHGSVDVLCCSHRTQLSGEQASVHLPVTILHVIFTFLWLCDVA